VLWSEIARETNKSKASIEKRFYELAHDPRWDLVTDQMSYEAFLANSDFSDDLSKSVIDALKNRNFYNILSAFQFYGSATLTSHIAIILSGQGNVKVRQLNTGGEYENFINTFSSFSSINDNYIILFIFVIY
jgi:bisphosphoglycerate-independent phosphoglycerate mutase (AlkP superfamily)